MKKIIGLMVCFLVLCALGTPALAAEAPMEISPEQLCAVEGNCIISQPGEVTTEYLLIGSGTLTIAENVTVKVVSNSMDNNGTIIVYGTLDLRECADISNKYGEIIVYGKIIVSPEWQGSFYSDKDIVISYCRGTLMIGDIAYIDEYGNEVGSIDQHGVECVNHYYMDGVCGCGATAPTGFTLSGGNWWIIVVGVAVIAAVVVAVVAVARKRRRK